ncbi:MAG: hypothetical protein EOO73_17305 [Myxococcales bacterium]|nr:MAG: hypothetical protein EOO73_17305 [Myxococcales bacterium]
MNHSEAQTTAHSAPDQNPVDRPGVPQEMDPPAPLGNAHWIRPDQQRSEAQPVIGHGRPLTPVYSVENPPRALSGLIRRAAYRVPDYRVRRWVMLMLADRVDVLESNPMRLLRGAALLSVLGLGAYGARRLLRS